MKTRELVLAAVLVILAVLWLSPFVSAGEVKAVVVDEDRAVLRIVVFDGYDGSVSTCVCSADAEYFYIFLTPAEETCEPS